MDTRRLGHSTLEVSAIGLGCMSGRGLYEKVIPMTTELTRDDLQEIDRAASQIHVTGDRYPEALEQLTGR